MQSSQGQEAVAVEGTFPSTVECRHESRGQTRSRQSRIGGFGPGCEAVEAKSDDRGIGPAGRRVQGTQDSLSDRSGLVDRAVIISIDWPQTEIWGYPNNE